MGKRQKERKQMSNQNNSGESAAPINDSQLKDGDAASNIEAPVNEAASPEQTSESGDTSVVSQPDEVAVVKQDDQTANKSVAKTEAAQTAFDATMVDPKIAGPLQAMQQTFDTYKENMKRGRPIEEHEGVRHQIALWTLIKSVLGREGQEFHVMFAHLLSLILAERDGGVLDPRLRYRFFGGLSLGQVDARNFESILQALCTLANPQERKISLKQVDLARVFDKYPDKAAAQRVMEFFGI